MMSRTGKPDCASGFAVERVDQHRLAFHRVFQRDAARELLLDLECYCPEDDFLRPVIRAEEKPPREPWRSRRLA
jgi:hypothetical protein